ncbi:MAG: protein kinase [Spirulinaceae cyanobacterium RM2_2_10]|nr:protein kinase [Spirulinaceae cyanobacterium RM2_2_10]
MSYCLNPDCQQPEQPGAGQFCQHCGTRLLLAGRYQPLALIGAGGFGRTLRACDTQKPSQPACVIKQFHPQGQTGASKAAQLFQQEAVRLEELGRHPQIPTLYAHCEQDARHYIVQELIEGADLDAELQSCGPFSEVAIRALLADLLPVLHFIHQGQVIHRDIKPENIIRRRDNRLLALVDFGAAKYATQSAIGQTGTAIGSAGYAAPEQNFGKANFSSDLYSLGVTCLHLLTGVEPLTLYRVEDASWAWRDRLPAPVSPALGEILDKLLERAVRRRYQSAVEVLAALEPGTVALPTASATAPARQLAIALTPVRSLASHTGAIGAIAFSAAASGLRPAAPDCTLNLWQRGAVWQFTTLTGHQAAIKSLAFSPNGKLLASGGLDRRLQVWLPGRSRPLASLTGHAAGIMAIAFSPDGRLLVSGSADGTVKLWQPNQAGLADTLTQESKYAGIWAIAFSPDGQQLVTGSAGGWLHIWQLATQTLEQCYRAHSGSFAGITTLAFSPDGQCLATGSQDRCIKLWRANGEQQGKLIQPQPVRAIAFSPDGDSLASGGDDGVLRLWAVATQQLVSEVIAHAGAIGAIAFSPDGQHLASGGVDKLVRLWSV